MSLGVVRHSLRAARRGGRRGTRDGGAGRHVGRGASQAQRSASLVAWHRFPCGCRSFLAPAAAAEASAAFAATSTPAAVDGIRYWLRVCE